MCYWKIGSVRRKILEVVCSEVYVIIKSMWSRKRGGALVTQEIGFLLSSDVVGITVCGTT